MNKQQRKMAPLLAWVLGLMALVVFSTPGATASPNSLAKPDPTTQAHLVESYGKLPLSFEANLRGGGADR